MRQLLETEQKALEINLGKHRHVYLLKEVSHQISEFISLLNGLRFNQLRQAKNRIFHFAYVSDWTIGEQSTEYTHPSLLADGFIHCSRIEDIVKSSEIYFESGTEVLLLEVDVDKLKPELVYA